MSEHKFDLIFMKPLPPAESEYPGFNPRVEKAAGMVIQYDAGVPMRDKVKIYVNIYRPEVEGQSPILNAWGPYGKHGRRTIYAMLGNTGLRDEDFNRHTAFAGGDNA
jgi:predicted acyl esterase